MKVRRTESGTKVQEGVSLDGFQDLFNPPRLSKPEIHLLLKPFFVLDRHGDRSKPIEYVYTVMQNGKATTRSWGVQPHHKYGLPGPFDRDVTLVLYELVNENYFSKQLPVPQLMPIGSLREFAQRMGISACGNNFAAIKESLNRLRNTFVDSEATFFDKRKKAYISISFRLLAGVGFLGEEDSTGDKNEQNFVMFDQVILNNLNEGYVAVIDVSAIQRLKTNIAKQLYVHLAHRFFVEAQDGDSSWNADYEWLAVHLGIKPQHELRFAKHQLKEAHEELKRLGYISSYSWDGWQISYCPGPVWKGEQLRRRSGRAKHQDGQLMLDLTPVLREPKDPLIPALAAFASGLSVGQERIKALGLTIEQAEALCAEKNLAIKPRS